MGLEHQFYLISKNKSDDIIDEVIIHDDIIQYILDSLDWIPSKNPNLSKNERDRGINYYGETIFDVSSAKIIMNIFTSWRDLFKNAPNTFELTGNFVYEENGETVHEFEKLMFERDVLITQFEKIIEMAKKLGEGDYYLYHRGV